MIYETRADVSTAADRDAFALTRADNARILATLRDAFREPSKSTQAKRNRDRISRSAN